MKIEIELDEATLRKLILVYFEEKLGSINLKPEDVKIEVRSKQNYRSEWETAAFRAVVRKVDLEA